MKRWQGLHLEPFMVGAIQCRRCLCFAVFVPAAALVFGVLAPLGVIELNYLKLHVWYGSWWGLMFTGTVICLPAFHAAHRIRHGLHDLKVGGGCWSILICYGIAAIVSVSALWVWFNAMKFQHFYQTSD